MRLAIVGSRRVANNPHTAAVARRWVIKALDYCQPEVVVSGGARGVDSIAASVAHDRGISVEEYLPENPRWEPDGFKVRNLRIVEACTHLLCIRHRDATTYGSAWTADKAQEAGRTVWRVRVP